MSRDPELWFEWEQSRGSAKHRDASNREADPSRREASFTGSRGRLIDPRDIQDRQPARYRDVSMPRWGTSEWPREQAAYDHRNVSPIGSHRREGAGGNGGYDTRTRGDSRMTGPRTGGGSGAMHGKPQHRQTYPGAGQGGKLQNFSGGGVGGWEYFDYDPRKPGK